ncbi:hypothetical protein K7X08_016864 [Anisodus acutangulus]|uniref:Uncharacterized protein n=1 Tax=Anisodus acutangulus TaxID=402998 RepID=A0A9Q1R5T8_9SOLA|nr:hypothetical protein K7X08_016864 [Anisodus acutangulus]
MTFRKTNDVPCKEATVVAFADLIHVGPITRHKFKTSGLDASEYFTSLEMTKKNKSQMIVVTAITRGNLASMLFDELSQTGCNFNESEDSTDSPILMKVSTLMDDATNIDEKFAMIEQTIEGLKNSIHDKNLQITQLMNKLEAFTLAESSYIPTCPPGFIP